MAIPSPEGMTADDFKQALLSSLESEHIGTLREIDKRLRERQILIEGYKIDPIKGYVAVKIDVLRNIRPADEVKRLADQGSKWLLEEVFGGLGGYVVVTDHQVRIEDMGYKGQGEEHGISIQSTFSIEHTYVMKDGKYLCEWGDPANPIHKPETLFEKRPVTREVEQRDGMHVITYNL
jgi:hypothetical protein